MTAAATAVVLAGAVGWLLGGPGWPRQRLAWLLRAPGAAPGAPLSGVVGELAGSARRRVRRVRTEDAARLAIVELCTGLAGELRAGRDPAEALRLAVAALARSDQEVFAGLVTVAGRGGDVPQAMRAVAERPGCRAVAWLAACWRVGAESGAGLAEAVERLADALRDEQRCRREIAAQLAAPRATARLLALLPLLGIVLATGLGQRPVAFLLGSPYGLACLAAGIGMNVLGLAWTVRLARSAEMR